MTGRKALMGGMIAMAGAISASLSAQAASPPAPTAAHPVPSAVHAHDTATATARSAIAAVLADSADAWNKADLDRFMHCYEPAPTTLYVSGSHTVHGTQAIRALYGARFDGGNRDAMGQLTLEIVVFRMLGADHAFVLGRFHLHRGAAHGGDAEGPTTLVFAHGQTGWRIIADHS